MTRKANDFATDALASGWAMRVLHGYERILRFKYNGSLVILLQFASD